MKRHSSSMVLFFLLALLAGPLVADNPERQPSGDSPVPSSSRRSEAKGRATKAKRMPGVTPEREAAAMTFVEQHHPALVALLIHLKEINRRQYDQAIRDLFRVSERLAQIQERDDQLYQLELKAWKAKSRSQLLAARYQMSGDDAVRDQLQTSLEEQYDLEISLVKRNRDKQAERLKKLDRELEKLEKDRHNLITKQLRLLTSPSAAAKKKGRPAEPDRPASTTRQ